MSDKTQSTHWSGCWRDHKDCAVAEVKRLRAALQYIADTGDPGFEVCDKTWYVWGDSMRRMARKGLK